MKTLNSQNTQIDNPILYGFSGHETFVFRYGWLKKGIDATKRQPNIFSQENALIELGVGKNMVSSIRYWALATQLLEENQRELQASLLGDKLLTDWDPFLEDIGSLWLIHWLLILNLTRAAVWNLAFTGFNNSDFNKEELRIFCKQKADEYKVRANENTIDRDVDCFIRTYLPSRNAKGVIEESFDCPLVELGLLRHDGDRYTFVIGEKPTLPLVIFGFALLNYFNQLSQRRSYSVQECVYNLGSPGQVFKLTENAVMGYLEQLAVLTRNAVYLDETEGLKQVYINEFPEPMTLLEAYYQGGTV